MKQGWALARDRWLGHRGRHILHTGSWSLVAKLAASANLFIAVPYVLDALGPAQFGVWATLVAFATFSTFLDFGFGNGAMNLVAAAHGRSDGGEVAMIWREAFGTLARVAGLILILLACLLPWLPWHNWLGLPQEEAAAALTSVAIVGIAIGLAVPLNLALRIQLALGRGHVAFRWQAAGHLLALITVVGLATAGAGLIALTAAAVGVPLLASLGNTVNLARQQEVRQQALPTLDEKRGTRSRIRSEGLLFFCLQVSAALAFTLDLPLITAVRGPEEAGTYAIVQRMFSLVPLSLGLLWTPLWPAYRQALASRHEAWIRRTLRHSLLLAAVFALVCGVALLLSFDTITALWLKRELLVSPLLLAGFATWCVLDATGTAIATYLNAASIIRFQLIVATAFAVACVTGKLIVLHAAGVDWMPWITASTYVMIFMLPTTLHFRRLVAESLDRTY